MSDNEQNAVRFPERRFDCLDRLDFSFRRSTATFPRIPKIIRNPRRAPIAEVTKATFVVDKDGIAASPALYDQYTHPNLLGRYERERYLRNNLWLNEVNRKQQAVLSALFFG